MTAVSSAVSRTDLRGLKTLFHYNGFMFKRIYIEITNVCNLSCSFCLKTGRTPYFMEPGEFRRIAAQSRKHTDYLYLHVQGEPFLHPYLDDILSICDELQFSVQLVTNGTLLDRHPLLLEHPCIRKISISLQSADFQPEDSLPSYIDSVLAFSEKSSDEGIYTELRFWRSDELQKESGSYCLERIKEQYQFQKTERTNSYRLKERLFLSFANDFEWPSASGSTEEEVSGTCLGARQQIAILSDGTVVPCCLDAGGQVPLGNLHENTLDEIIQGPRCQELIRQFQTHRIKEPFCRNCTFRKRFG